MISKNNSKKMEINKKSHKNKIDPHKYERKKGEMIQLKTDLPNVPISNKLIDFRSPSVNEILNQPVKEKKKSPVVGIVIVIIVVLLMLASLICGFLLSEMKIVNKAVEEVEKKDEDNKTIVKEKKKFGLRLFNKGVRKGFLNNSLVSLDISKPNLEIFNTMEVLTKPTFKVSVNKTVIPNNNNNNKHNTFKILLKENYSHYITSLKKIYPSFKFNHYKKFAKEHSDYIKKYGEESDINNRHYNSINNGELLSFRFIKKDNDNKEYHKSNLLEILGAQENIECDPKDFKIKDDFLSRKSLSELRMIQKDLQFKTGVIEKELDFILMNYPQKLYNYIENNKDLAKKIKEYQVILIQRRYKKKRVIN